MLNAGEFNASTPLFEGGDCEDCVQRICEIVNTIESNLDIMIRTVRDHLGLDFDPPAICGVFGITSCFYMARGIYHDPNPDDGNEAETSQQHESTGNHTFGVVAHTVAACFHFLVIECVSAVLILHDKEGSECRSQHYRCSFVFICQGNLSMCGTFLIRLLPRPNNHR